MTTKKTTGKFLTTGKKDHKRVECTKVGIDPGGGGGGGGGGHGNKEGGGLEGKKREGEGLGP